MSAANIASAVRPFLVVTPLGLEHATALADELDRRRISVISRDPLKPWSRASTALYRRGSGAVVDARAQRFEDTWRDLFPTDHAELWSLADHGGHRRLASSKSELRGRFPTISLPRVDGDPARFALHPFHVPEVGDIASEWSRLLGFRCEGSV